MNNYDVAVVGAGAAGIAAALTADRLRASVALIEKARPGGQHLWTGNVPIRCLVRSAAVFDIVKRAEEFGVHLENQRLVWGALQLRIAAVRDDIRQLQREKFAATKIQLITGKARCEAPGQIIVSDKDGAEQTIHAQRIIWATGSTPRIPEILGLAETGFLTTNDFFELKNLPRSWIVLSSEPVGCEMAQALARLGCKVTLIQTSRALLPYEEPDVSAEAEKILRNEGVNVFCDAHIWRAQVQGERKQLEFEVKGKIHTTEASEILVLAGRKVRFDTLNAEATGATYEERGLLTDDFLQAAPGLWACGAVTTKSTEANHPAAQGQLAAENALTGAPKKWDPYAIPSVIATDPEIAHVGLTEEQARREHAQPAIHRREFKTLDRAIIDGEAHGFLKIITTSHGRIAGVHIVGPGAGEMIHQFVPAVRDGISLAEFSATVALRASLSEITTGDW